MKFIIVFDPLHIVAAGKFQRDERYDKERCPQGIRRVYMPVPVLE